MDYLDYKLVGLFLISLATLPWTKLQQDDTACHVHPRLLGYHSVELFCWRIGPGPCVDQVHSPCLLDRERKDQVLYPQICHIHRPRDVQVLQCGAVLTKDGQHLVVTQTMKDYMPQFLHFL